MEGLEQLEHHAIQIGGTLETALGRLLQDILQHMVGSIGVAFPHVVAGQMTHRGDHARDVRLFRDVGKGDIQLFQGFVAFSCPQVQGGQLAAEAAGQGHVVTDGRLAQAGEQQAGRQIEVAAVGRGKTPVADIEKFEQMAFLGTQLAADAGKDAHGLIVIPFQEGKDAQVGGRGLEQVGLAQGFQLAAAAQHDGMQARIVVPRGVADIERPDQQVEERHFLPVGDAKGLRPGPEAEGGKFRDEVARTGDGHMEFPADPEIGAHGISGRQGQAEQTFRQAEQQALDDPGPQAVDAAQAEGQQGLQRFELAFLPQQGKDRGEAIRLRQPAEYRPGDRVCVQQVFQGNEVRLRRHSRTESRCCRFRGQAPQLYQQIGLPAFPQQGMQEIPAVVMSVPVVSVHISDPSTTQATCPFFGIQDTKMYFLSTKNHKLRSIVKNIQ